MIAALTNHLWQSTVFAVVAGLLTIAFRKNRAQVRYWLWFSASFKFFVPFSLLMSVGRHLQWASAAKKIAAPAVSFTMEQIAQPFSDFGPITRPAPRSTDWAFIAFACVWACGFMAIAVIRIRGWLRIREAVRASTSLNFPAPVEVRSSPGLLEPGVVGWLHPVLLLPAGIVERLTPHQLKAVLAHELCHVRRRDNLFASIHMIVEAIFWFHPLVWWIGARLVDERERACDEEVLRIGNEPRVYAEGILSVCKHYVESPLVCVSGVTGADLKRRIESIMANRTGQRLNRARKLLLASAGVAALAVPLVIGVGNAPSVRAQASPANPPQFEVASIRVSKDPAPFGNVDLKPGRFRGKDLKLGWLILVAYKLRGFQVSGLPDRLDSEQYNIEAKTEAAASEDQTLLMLQKLLEDRFRLRFHYEMKEGPVYALTIGKNGVKMKPGICVPSVEDLPNECGRFGREDGSVHTLDWRGVGMSAPTGVAYRSLAWQLSLTLNRPVIDKTGLSGGYDVHLRWTEQPTTGIQGQPDHSGDPALPADMSGPSIFTAVQEQLGLKLESARGPVEILVIDHAEKPSEN